MSKINLPLNGRIAIVDDQIEQVEPLIKVLSKNRIPFTYYSGKLEDFPINEKDNIEFNNFNIVENDIRVMFLDLNYEGDIKLNLKNLRSNILGILKKIILNKNLPYILIYWSKHDDEDTRNFIEKQIFNDENLFNIKPIDFLSANKSNFYSKLGDKNEKFEENIKKLFENINDKLKEIPINCCLMDWENNVHKSTSKTLKEVFPLKEEKEIWINNSNNIFNTIGKAHYGEDYINQDLKTKIKSSFNVLNSILADTIENNEVENVYEIKSNEVNDNNKKSEEKIIDFKINRKLLISIDEKNKLNSGSVIKIEDDNKKDDNKNITLLCNILKGINKDNFKETKEKSEDFFKEFELIWLNVDPICDTAQNKIVFHKFVKGFLIKIDDSDHKKFIKKTFENNDSVFISPIFTFENETLNLNGNYITVLDFKHFFTIEKLEFEKDENINILFRIRQQLLSEIQSKLSRHINRQGVLSF